MTWARKSLSDRLFDVVLYAAMIFTVVVTLYPFLNVLAISLNDSTDTVRGGIHIWPREFTLKNYETIFQYSGLMTGFRNSVIRTLAGTLIGVISASMVAYVLSREEFQARRLFSMLFALTMYFSGGLIPVYMLMRDLSLLNSFWVYLIPGLLSVWNVFIIRSYINGLPYALQESAKIDGANDFTIYWRVVLPLCQPVLATVALFIAVGQWNSWFDTYLYNSSNESLTTLQYELMKVLQSTQNNADAARNPNMAQNIAAVSPESIRMAITIVVTLPILLVYPFLQKYFVKGMTLGAVKS
ncbi:carbohydrate ABC transporter permease [Paenibacillus mucilaginosus]|uniref:Binding-protein-dependent transport system inner membrane component n=1 Tax=Paenibacillus mucilaginosus (strain KNP414) TaxID=1036673 RepID=F8FNH4_PAEMK|nr:carbohydrate ABC transporter permease [Paenibacillus mucilaginosus]AEI39011.1 binding-protein-dependent transport system inner membrane component [Paenibacillus mucilaginosus KNP414]MCG7216147.1 carbohydrate ABC transporter permease [Paenibacillus mucilaginosus]WDM28051.1 carbohydrate ABC transporter permease [Paenibacillus mucilaginosus]